MNVHIEVHIDDQFISWDGPSNKAYDWISQLEKINITGNAITYAVPSTSNNTILNSNSIAEMVADRKLVRNKTTA